jgi:hypothetical protein
MSLSHYILPFFTVLLIQALSKEHKDMFKCNYYYSNTSLICIHILLLL